jgi:hypothetical protein
MGTLDDAIREHLELKRRLGAPEDELEQKEAEAFGPAGQRRPAAEDVHPEAPPAEPARPEEPVPVAEDFEPTETETEAETEAEAEPAPEPAGRWTDEEVLDRDEVLPEDALEPNGSYGVPDPVPPSREGSTSREETLAEWDEDEEGPAGEDVLEETPDFLEETPEHDRLWFEQKPPKDFDFE